MAQNKKKCRQYNVDYLRYGFIPSPTNPQLPMCLLCEQVFSNKAMKPSRLKEHLPKMHPDKASKELNYFQVIKERHSKRVGETLVLPAVKEAVSTVMEQDSSAVVNAIPLSNDTVARRIKEMSVDTEEQLSATLRVNCFSIQLDETTTGDNNALLMAYVRYLSDCGVTEEFLFGKYLITDTRGQTIFSALEEYFQEKSIPFSNLLACATDGAPAMVGRYRGFIALLKERAPDILTVHCILHRHNLVAKNISPQLHKSLDFAVKSINKIKAHALNDRLFRQLCSENDEMFERLLLHTEVRWLSRGNCLSRLCELFATVLEFLGTKDVDLRNNLFSSQCDIFYLADLFEKMNEVTLKLQGNGVTLVHSKTTICSFLVKMDLYRETVGRRQFNHFPRLATVSSKLTDEELLCYTEHLRMIKADMELRFRDLQNLQVPYWILEPFQVDVFEKEPIIQEHLIDLQNDEEAQATFHTSGWQGFSQVLYMQSKYRNRLNLIASGALRLKLSSLNPSTKTLAANHQGQGSH
ncbi:zinc finger BED domain-containing protein 5-like [Nothobranchius furzeri]|uniref:zinc finger BED domain-containing protein 5-like n=1 Tax=Nothobranchius furzeri TaxID=105023 RepID=UPI0039046ACB